MSQTMVPASLLGSAVSSLRSYRGVWRWAIVVGWLQTCYAVGFIARSSFVVEGRRYFCLFDDAMISMRYAANWANGQGLVWNPGERVEGYTNFAWTLLMGFCHLLRLSPSHTCLLVQLLGIPILWLCLFATVRLARACRLLSMSAICALVLGATCYNLVFLTLFGMETGLVTCLVTLALAEGVLAVRHRTHRVASMLWFAPALLMRPDVLPLMGFLFLFLGLTVPEARGRLVLGALLVTSVVGAHLLWRHHYYGQWLPNTYYLKATGWRLADRLVPGFSHTLWTVAQLGLPFLLATLALVRAKRWHFLLLGGFLTMMAYQLYIGGDVWPICRFVLPTSLGLFVLAGVGIHRMTAWWVRDKTRLRGTLVRAGLTVLTVVAMNAIPWDHALLLTRPQTALGNLVNVRYALAVDRVATPEASVAVHMAGAFPYFSQRKCFDCLGKCDPHIARLLADPNIRWAGHNKRDTPYVLRTYAPDIVLHAANTRPRETVPGYRPVSVVVDGTAMVLCVRQGSPRIRGGQPVSWALLTDEITRLKGILSTDKIVKTDAR